MRELRVICRDIVQKNISRVIEVQKEYRDRVEI